MRYESDDSSFHNWTVATPPFFPGRNLTGDIMFFPLPRSPKGSQAISDRPEANEAPSHLLGAHVRVGLQPSQQATPHAIPSHRLSDLVVTQVAGKPYRGGGDPNEDYQLGVPWFITGNYNETTETFTNPSEPMAIDYSPMIIFG